MSAPRAWAQPRGRRRGSLPWRGKVFGGVEECEEKLGAKLGGPEGSVDEEAGRMWSRQPSSRGCGLRECGMRS